MSMQDISSNRFGEALTAVLARANNMEVDVEGSWECETKGDDPRCWDVQITAVEQESD